MNVQTCIEVCDGVGSLYAGVHLTDCYCQSILSTAKRSNTLCSTACMGTKQFCGADSGTDSFMAVYEIGMCA